GKDAAGSGGPGLGEEAFQGGDAHGSTAALAELLAHGGGVGEFYREGEFRATDVEGLRLAQEFAGAAPGGLEEIFALLFERLELFRADGAFGEVGERADERGIKQTAKGIMGGTQLK